MLGAPLPGSKKPSAHDETPHQFFGEGFRPFIHLVQKLRIGQFAEIGFFFQEFQVE